MEAAARSSQAVVVRTKPASSSAGGQILPSSSHVVRTKRASSATVIPAVAAAAASSSWPRRRRAAQIPSLRRARAKKKTLRPHPLRPDRSWGLKRARSKLTLPRPNPKRARSTDDLPCPPDNNNWRDWANLADGPAGLIADRVLAYDVADYVRFRAVCRPWRQSCTDPRLHSSRRFHPWRWTMLGDKLPVPDRRRFLNLSTGQCIQVHIPELRDHELLAVTPEGVLILVRNPERTAVSMLNPLTRHLAELPPFTALLPSQYHQHLHFDSFSASRFKDSFSAWGSGIVNDDSTLVLCFNTLRIIGVAKPGDVCWTVLTTPLVKTCSMFAGRFYCVTEDGVMVLEDQPLRMELVAELPMVVPSMTDTAHLVDCSGELMLVHRRFSRQRAWNNVYKRRFDAYRVDLDAATMCRVNSFGGGRHALFIGTDCSFAVPIKVFPSGSISGDTIYLRFDIDERDEIEGCNLADRRMISSCNLDLTSLVAGPHTLVDCLSFV